MQSIVVYSRTQPVRIQHALLVFIATALSLPGVAQELRQRPSRTPIEVVSSKLGVVVSDSPLASEVGRDVLAQGGNAVDAAIATAFSLAVTWPEAGNIGGGGFMLVAPPGEDVVCVEYREKAPKQVNENSFRNWQNRRHARVVGVPGTVRGMAAAHRRYGRLPWKRLVETAAILAEKGFAVDRELALSLNFVLQLESTQNDPRYAEFRRVYGNPEGRPWREGDLLIQRDLARTLRLIANKGADEFYSGSIAQLIVQEMKRGDGLITARDLADYTCNVRPTVSGTVRGFTVYGAPLPSSGGATVLMQLRMIDALDLKVSPNQFWNVDHVHQMTEVMRRAFRERAAGMGDADFVKVPDSLLDEQHAKQLAESIDRNRAIPSTEIAGDIQLTAGPPESSDTTHFSVIDADGMAVSNTYTLEARFGSRIVVRGAGFLLNNEMGDFNWVPGYTNLDGQIGTPPNRIEPEKRMLSSQSPTIVKKDCEVVLVIGSPGGRTIINTVTEILVQVLFFDRSLAKAIEGPRFHHQWLPDVIVLEDDDEELFAKMSGDLIRMGHTVRQLLDVRQGSVNAISVEPTTQMATGVADWRRGASAKAVGEKSVRQRSDSQATNQ